MYVNKKICVGRFEGELGQTVILQSTSFESAASLGDWVKLLALLKDAEAYVEEHIQKFVANSDVIRSNFYE